MDDKLPMEVELICAGFQRATGLDDNKAEEILAAIARYNGLAAPDALLEIARDSDVNVEVDRDLEAFGYDIGVAWRRGASWHVGSGVEFPPPPCPWDGDGEGGFRTPAGEWLVYPKTPNGVDYVRVVSNTGVEFVYWDSQEWKEDPQGVMGAILGAIVGGADPFSRD